MLVFVEGVNPQDKLNKLDPLIGFEPTGRSLVPPELSELNLYHLNCLIFFVQFILKTKIYEEI